MRALGLTLIVILLVSFLSLTLFIRLAKSDNGLLALWTFDEGSGTVAHDSSGNGNNLALDGPTWVDGKYGKALSFDGLDDSLENTTISIMKQVPLTLSAWVKPELRADGTDFPNNVISNDRPSHYGNGFGVNVWTTGSQMKVECENAWRTVPGVSFTASNWYYVAVVYTSGNVKSYINGLLVDSFPYQQAVPESESCVRIGRHNDDIFTYWTTRFFKGTIDEVRIYGRALTLQEILVDMSGGVFSDEFNGNTLNPAWTWVDQVGDCNYSLTANPGYLRISVPSKGHDLYPPSNFNAPRLMQIVNGDFAIETKVLFDPTGTTNNTQAAGILIWQSTDNYLRLDRELDYRGQIIEVSGVKGGIWSKFGQTAYLNTTAYLRLERSGANLTAKCSANGIIWTMLFASSFQFVDPVSLGLFVINEWTSAPPVFADFDYFRITSAGFHKLTVSVADPSNHPIIDASVTAADLTAKTDLSGQVSFVLLGGTYNVSASSDGYINASWLVDLESDQNISLTLAYPFVFGGEIPYSNIILQPVGSGYNITLLNSLATSGMDVFFDWERMGTILAASWQSFNFNHLPSLIVEAASKGSVDYPNAWYKHPLPTEIKPINGTEGAFLPEPVPYVAENIFVIPYPPVKEQNTTIGVVLHNPLNHTLHISRIDFQVSGLIIGVFSFTSVAFLSNVTLQVNETHSFSINWIPDVSGHHCVRVVLTYSPDSQTVQRNLEIEDDLVPNTTGKVNLTLENPYPTGSNIILKVHKQLPVGTMLQLIVNGQPYDPDTSPPIYVPPGGRLPVTISVTTGDKSGSGTVDVEGIIDGNLIGGIRKVIVNNPSKTQLYDVTVDAYCNTEKTPVKVSFTMDGIQRARYETPQTFYGLTGTHSLTVPDSDANGHSFKDWSTGETTTSITVSIGGTYIANYEARPLGAPKVLTGIIFEDLNLNGVPDKGEDLSDVTVKICNATYAPLPNEPTLTTKDDGQYKFDVTGLSDGEYTVKAYKNNYQPWYATVQLGQRDYLTVNIDLIPLASETGHAKGTSQNAFGPCPVNGFVSNGKDMAASFTASGTLCYLFYPYIGEYEQINYHVKDDYQYGPGHAPIQTAPYGPWMGSFPGIRIDTGSTPRFFWLTNDASVTQRQYYSSKDPSSLITQYFLEFTDNGKLYTLNITETALVDIFSPTLTMHFEVHNLGAKISNVDIAYYSSFDVNTASSSERGPTDSFFQGHYHIIDLTGFLGNLLKGVVTLPTLSWDWPYTQNNVGFNGADSSVYWTNPSDGTTILVGGDGAVQKWYLGQSGKPGETDAVDAYSHCMIGSSGSSGSEQSSTGNAYLEWSLGSPDTVATSLTLYVAASKTLGEAQSVLSSAKSKEFSSIQEDTSIHWNNWLYKAEQIVETGQITCPQVFLRGLLSIKMMQEEQGPNPGAIISAPTLQPEYCHSWPRDGTFEAVSLDLAGYHQDAEEWYSFLKSVQNTTADEDNEKGYWLMCYQPDGTYVGDVDWYKSDLLTPEVPLWLRLIQSSLPPPWNTFNLVSLRDAVRTAFREFQPGPESDQQGIILWGLSVHYEYSDEPQKIDIQSVYGDMIRNASDWIKDHIWNPWINKWRDGLLFPATDKDETFCVGASPNAFEQSLWANSAGYAGLKAAQYMGFDGYSDSIETLKDSIDSVFYSTDTQTFLKTLGYGYSPRDTLGVSNPAKIPVLSNDFADVLGVGWPYAVSALNSAAESWFTQVATGSWKASTTSWTLLFFTIYAQIHKGITANDYYSESLKAPVSAATSTCLLPEGLVYSKPAGVGAGESWGKDFSDGRRAIGLGWSEAMFVIASLAKTEQFKVAVNSPVDLHLYDPYRQHTGLNYASGQTEEGVPYSDYTGRQEPQSIAVTFPTKGTYVIQLVGTNDGPFELDVALSRGGATTTISYAGTISKGTVKAFTIDTSTSNPVLVPGILDTTAPATALTIGEPKYVYPISNVTYVTQYTPFALEASDNESGVSYTAYHAYDSTYDGGWQNYTTQFVLDSLKDGNYTIEFYSVDYAGNVEATNSANVTLHWLYGDVNHDGKVSLSDLTLVAAAYHSRPGYPHWNQNADIAPPWGIISLTDVVTVALHYGQTFRP